MKKTRAAGRNGITPQQAAARLRKAGLKVTPGTGRPFKPLDIAGLRLSEALEEARGKRAK